MTCIIGLETKNNIWMGCDSASTDGWNTRLSKNDKIFWLGGGFVIGFTSSWRMGQILRYQVKIEKQKENETDECFMITKFVEAVRDTFKSYGFAKIENNEEKGGLFLVGYKGKLYQICANYHVNRFNEKYSAVGGGAEYALGAMYAARNQPPRKRIMIALRASAKFNNGVAGPFHIYKYRNEMTEG